MTTGEESGATVTLSADTKPFEQAFDKAHSYAAGWAGKMEGVFASIDKAASSSGKEIGSTLGNAIGGALGMVAGGPIGAALGTVIGGIGGEYLWTAFSEGGEKAFSDLTDFADKTLARLSDGIDSIWNRVQEPLAKVADFIQKIGVQLGLVEEGTESWGDSIRAIEDVGVKVLANLAYGFGYLEGIFKVVGGYAIEYIGLPLTKVIAKITEGIATLLRGVNQLLEDSGIGKFEWADRAADKLDKMSESMTKSLAAKKALGEEFMNTNPLENAERRAAQITGSIDRGKELNDQELEAAANAQSERSVRNFSREEEDASGAQADRIAAAAKALEAVATSVDAMVQGSQQANNAIIKTQNEMNARAAAGAKPEDKTAAAAENIEKHTKRAADNLNDINRKFNDAPILRAV